MACEPQSKHRILVHPSVRGGPYTQPGPRRPEAVARALTEPGQDLPMQEAKVTWDSTYHDNKGCLASAIGNSLCGGCARSKAIRDMPPLTHALDCFAASNIAVMTPSVTRSPSPPPRAKFRPHP